MNINHKDIEYFENVNLASYTTMKLKSFGNLYLVKSIEGLSFLLKNCKEYKILGLGANTLFDEIELIPIIKLDFSFNRSTFDEVRVEYHIPASVNLSLLVSHAAKFGLVGWSALTGIPATLGGAIAMNAGTGLGEIKSILKSVTVMSKNSNIFKIIVNKDSFSYRKNNFLKEGDIIIAATLKNIGIDESIKKEISKYLKIRTNSQPLKENTCGCVFKNIKKDTINHKISCLAGMSVDIMGLKGLELGSLKVSNKHANFIENHGDSNSHDMKQLIDIIQEVMIINFGIKFPLEAKLNTGSVK